MNKMAQKTFKKIFEQQFDIDLMHHQIIKKMEQKKRRNQMFKLCLIPACMITLICGTLFFGNTKQTLQNPSQKDAAIHINQLDNMGAYKLDADVKLVEKKDLLEKYSFLNHLTLPPTLSEHHQYEVYTKDQTQKVYNILHDSVLEYQNEEGNKEIKLSFSELEKPLRDYYFKENGKNSTIKNQELLIFNYKTHFMVTFQHDNLYFDIETTNITQEELVTLITSIL